MPGNCRPRSSRAACTVAPVAATSALPPVCCRIGVGTLILIAMQVPRSLLCVLNSRSELSTFSLVILHQRRLGDLLQERLELQERRADDRRLLQAIDHGILRFQAVAGDAQDDFLLA